MKRKIKINNIVFDIDISDGKDQHPFSMSGLGSFDIYFNDVKCPKRGFVEGNDHTLDGEINYRNEIKQIGHDNFTCLIIDDPMFKELEAIPCFSSEDVEKIPFQKRIENILFGLKYEDIERINSGYRYGKELTYKHFCITFDKERLVVYSSNHNGYMTSDYLYLDQDMPEFEIITNEIKKSINDFFAL